MSGGQDSMALVGLLLGLQPQHRWRLVLWHGDHRWRGESMAQALELQAWARGRKLLLLLDSWQRGAGEPPSEAAAREWRYGCLALRARQLASRRVVTGHTASDRAETLLLHLARGSHRRGLASLGHSRPLAPGIELVRPLLAFSRTDTARICRELELPLWLDSSNLEPHFSRNRVRQQVLPVLESLHPGAARRMARSAQQLAEAELAQEELLLLALKTLEIQAPAGGLAPALDRRGLEPLQRANQGQLIQAWLEGLGRPRFASRILDGVLDRLQDPASAGRSDLGDGWQLHWRARTLWLSREV
ncbi:MAG: tRNA lysidine(34) synthetase TilS [Cyanobium sp.]